MKQSLWSVHDEIHHEIDFKGEVTLDVSVSDTQWTLATTAKVYAGQERKTLFQTTAVRAVTLSRSACASACVFQAYYRVDDLAEEAPSQPLQRTEHDERVQAQNAYIKEVGVTTWARIMRRKDQRMRVLFEELGQIQE